MNNKLNRKLIQNQAERILKDYQITKFPVDPKEIAEKENILIQAKNDCEPGVSAMLIKTGDDFGIFYATYLNNPGFENFSIAHELGHYFLEDHIDFLFKTNQVHLSNAGYVGSEKIEHEADTFAAALLMPEDLFKDKLKEYEKGFACIGAMASLCNTSLTATAIRYAQLTDNKVVILISTDGIVDYCCISDSIFKLGEIEIPKKGCKILPDTATYLFSKNPDKVLESEKTGMETRFIDWLECKSMKKAYEEVIGLGKYGKILTVIS